MTWVKLDDALPQNMKVGRVTDLAFRVYVLSICYCGANLTDGVVERSLLAHIPLATPKVAKELEAAGLWEPHPDGWYVHDYLEWNRSKALIEADREKNRANGLRGLAKRYGKLLDEPLRQSPSSGQLQIARSALSDPSVPDVDPDTGEISERERDLPSNSLAKPRRRLLDTDAVAKLQAEFPAIDVTAAAADYLNWSGSQKHVDKVLGLRNQLGHPACAAKFPRRHSEEPYDVRKSKFLAGPLAGLVAKTGVER